VVDSDSRVHGITGLRVAHASVMSSIRSTNTVATVHAERAADRIAKRRPTMPVSVFPGTTLP
jgi:choline dehydrogenase